MTGPRTSGGTGPGDVSVGGGERGGEEPIAAAVEALRSGHLLVHPTSSVYGIGAVARELDAEIARLKGRSPEHPLLRVAGSLEALRRAHRELRWSEEAERLAAALWPGPLTLVLDDGSGDGLGVRVEGHDLTRRVLLALDDTMSSTSLNRTGEPPADSEEAVRRTLSAMPTPRVTVRRLLAGDLPGPPPSTVLSLRGDRPCLLREGAVPLDRIAGVLGREPARA